MLTRAFTDEEAHILQDVALLTDELAARVVVDSQTQQARLSLPGAPSSKDGPTPATSVESGANSAEGIPRVSRTDQAHA